MPRNAGIPAIPRCTLRILIFPPLTSISYSSCWTYRSGLARFVAVAERLQGGTTHR
jgi:hypothetical protein